MDFQQLIMLIPWLDQVHLYQTSHQLKLEEGQHALLIIRRGHVTVTTEGKDAAICTQGYACHPQRSMYSIEVPKTREAEYGLITYRMIPEGQEWNLDGPLSTFSEIKIHYMLDEILRIMEPDLSAEEEVDVAQRFRLRLMLERVLYIYLYESGMKKEEKSAEQAIEDTISYMNEHYMLMLTLPMLAMRAGMSEGHFTVLFKKYTGATMTTYMRKLRIEKAKQLFQQTDLTAKEIAQKAGFSDYFYFSRMFKKEVGCSPIAYKKSVAEI
ncbi:AraC family transcriptional regulator [Paenibacillus sp. Soil522]|uniref:AraC family transcriptional regulator n=1 Tax=Paenibacillus sp. Soil522 TaxID=1736388 RepID=UPI0007021B01|nr:AraC family transcriptional regulator [Paenibacillus sp. Soil522]KRE47828.1 AraC family transcriptional regulator [Paenibacillus sp. Soil522]